MCDGGKPDLSVVPAEMEHPFCSRTIARKQPLIPHTARVPEYMGHHTIACGHTFPKAVLQIVTFVDDDEVELGHRAADSASDIVFQLLLVT